MEKLNINLTDKDLYYKKVVKPTAEQIQLHKSYLKKTLKKNFFN